MLDLSPQPRRFARVRDSVMIVVAVTLLAVAVAVAAPRASADEAPAPNSGLPGSTCQSINFAEPYAPPGPGVTTFGLGLGAPAYYEVGSTTGAFAGKRSKGIMIEIHGGAWFGVGRAMVAMVRPYVDHWRARGWQTVNIDYRGCGQSIADVFWFMQRIRQLAPKAVICASGMSAGGHLALLLASIRKDLACVINEAGPSDFAALPQQTAYDQTLSAYTSVVPTTVYNVAVSAFGAAPYPLNASSPIRYVSNVTARVLLAAGELDDTVPTAQNADYAAALKAARPNAYVDVVLLPFGPEPYVHTHISLDGANELLRRELALVAPYG